MTGVNRWAVILMDGTPAPAVHHAWYIEGDEEAAEAFRKFVSDEIDPAVKVRLHDAAGELLRWRTSVAPPSGRRALREIPPLPPEVVRLMTQLRQAHPVGIEAGLGVKLAIALGNWMTGDNA